jgi:hypothetical protein
MYRQKRKANRTDFLSSSQTSKEETGVKGMKHENTQPTIPMSVTHHQGNILLMRLNYTSKA